MILYWAWPTDGAGHATRAASICRHFKEEVLVIRGTADPKVNKALEHFGIKYAVFTDKKEAIEFSLAHKAEKFVLDDAVGSALDKRATVHLWRVGRPSKPIPRVPCIKLEGPGSLWPVLMLDDDEILSKEDAREDLGWPQDKFLTVGITCTSRPGVVESQEVDYMLDRWPALKWMRAADHIVGTMGANLYGEVHYLGIPATWLIAPHTRDQFFRAQATAIGQVTPEAALKVARIIEAMH